MNPNKDKVYLTANELKELLDRVAGFDDKNLLNELTIKYRLSRIVEQIRDKKIYDYSGNEADVQDFLRKPENWLLDHALLFIEEAFGLN